MNNVLKIKKKKVTVSFLLFSHFLLSGAGGS